MENGHIERMLSWAEDRRELKNLIGKYAQCILQRRDSQVVDLLWSRRQDICLGCNEGYYQGAEAVRGYYASVAARTKKSTELLMAALPELFEGKTAEEALGAGWLEFKPAQDPVFEIQGDMARGVWYSQGNTTEIGLRGPLALWTFGSYEGEFVREQDGWRILKLVYMEDVRCPVGSDWRVPEEASWPELPEFAALRETPIAPPNVPEILRIHCSPERLFSPLPEPPGADSEPQEDMDGLPEKEALQLRRILAREKIEQLMGRRVFYSANLEWNRELKELWVQSPTYQDTASFGGTWGFHVGMDAIRRFYADGQEKKLESLRAGQNTERGRGVACAYPLTSPAIQVAGDGKTAKGLWYSIGYRILGGEEAIWICRKIAADFVLENGQWRIWHLCEVHDGTLSPGHDFGEQKARLDPGEDPLEAEFGQPTISVLTHDRLFCWSDDFPWMPEPYAAMQPELCYDYTGFQARRWEAPGI